MLLTTLQGSPASLGLHTLLQLSQPLVPQTILDTNPALALLLAANSQAANNQLVARGPWGDSMLPMDMASMAPAFMHNAALASSMAACCNPSMHTQEDALAPEHMPSSNFASQFMVPSAAGNSMTHAGGILPRMAMDPWQGLTEGLYQPVVPPPTQVPSSLHVTDAISEASVSMTHLGFGPQRHNHGRDIRHARHSPY